MFDNEHRARAGTLVRIINSKDRSLERVGYIEIVAVVKGKSIGGRGVITKENRVLASVGVTYDSIGRRPYTGNESNVLDRGAVCEIGGYALNLRSCSHEGAHVSDVNLLVPMIKLKTQEGRYAKIALGDKLAIFIEP